MSKQQELHFYNIANSDTNLNSKFEESGYVNKRNFNSPLFHVLPTVEMQKMREKTPQQKISSLI